MELGEASTSPTTAITHFQGHQNEQEDSDSHHREYEEQENGNILMLQRDLWLVRIPPDVSAKWSTATEESVVGKLTMTVSRSGNGEGGSQLTLDLPSGDGVQSPRPGSSKTQPVFNKYKLVEVPVSGGGSNNGIFAAWINSSETDVDVRVAGSVKKKFKAFPIRDEKYKEHIKTKRDLMKLSQRPVQLEKAVNCYKPVANHANNVAYEKKKKLEGRKMRGEKEEVAQQLFKAFETHQFYTFKDLIKLTNQPASFLKELLNEYCNYSTKGTHRSFWELKPEYRHYEEGDEANK